MDTECSYPEVKRPGPFSDEANEWIYTSTPQYIFHAWCLITQKTRLHVRCLKYERSVTCGKSVVQPDCQRPESDQSVNQQQRSARGWWSSARLVATTSWWCSQWKGRLRLALPLISPLVRHSVDENPAVISGRTPPPHRLSHSRSTTQNYGTMIPSQVLTYIHVRLKGHVI